jgi:hypothetical protein
MYERRFVSFSSYMYVEKAGKMMFVQKNACKKNVDEIYGRGRFHQTLFAKQKDASQDLENKIVIQFLQLQILS